MALRMRILVASSQCGVLAGVLGVHSMPLAIMDSVDGVDGNQLSVAELPTNLERHAAPSE